MTTIALFSPPQQLWDNRFTGPFPTELGQLDQMTVGFRFSSNSFTGPLPTELGRLDQMTTQMV